MTPDQFWERSSVTTHGCREWKGAKGSNGYGHLHFFGAYVDAHRVAWTLAFGEIAPGMHVLHHCDNKLCVLPDHLFLGTPADNIHDMDAKGRRRAVGPASDRSRQTRLTWTSVGVIRWANATMGFAGDYLASRFGVERTAISNIVSGHTWRLQDDPVRVPSPAAFVATVMAIDWVRPDLHPRGESHYKARLDVAQIQEIRRLVASGMTHQSVADRFDLARQTVGDIANRRRWKHVD